MKHYNKKAKESSVYLHGLFTWQNKETEDSNNVSSQ